MGLFKNLFFPQDDKGKNLEKDVDMAFPFCFKFYKLKFCRQSYLTLDLSASSRKLREICPKTVYNTKLNPRLMSLHVSICRTFGCFHLTAVCHLPLWFPWMRFFFCFSLFNYMCYQLPLWCWKSNGNLKSPQRHKASVGVKKLSFVFSHNSYRV